MCVAQYQNKIYPDGATEPLHRLDIPLFNQRNKILSPFIVPLFPALGVSG